MPSNGTLRLAVSAAWRTPSRDRVAKGQVNGRRIWATGSHVPCQSPNQARAASMPDTAWAVDRTPPRLIPKRNLPLGSDVICSLSTRHQRFALAHLLGSHLTCSWHAVSATLTTPALDRRSLRWFRTSPCRATPEDLPPSLTQHRIKRNDLLHQFLLQRSWHTGMEELRGLRPRRSSRSARRASSSVMRAACCSANSSSAAT